MLQNIAFRITDEGEFGLPQSPTTQSELDIDDWPPVDGVDVTGAFFDVLFVLFCLADFCKRVVFEHKTTPTKFVLRPRNSDHSRSARGWLALYFAGLHGDPSIRGFVLF
ncbi:hypothetical protein TRICHSKD4_0624 [Roseibium sp. TrichSKD4]|nr:hypothetical protein TRICHSKD4_0624 [Roseibium sp. TrichSKD4]